MSPFCFRILFYAMAFLELISQNQSLTSKASDVRLYSNFEHGSRIVFLIFMLSLISKHKNHFKLTVAHWNFFPSTEILQFSLKNGSQFLDFLVFTDGLN